MAERELPVIVRYALELFASLGALRVRAMFGGWGIYCDDVFFAIVAKDVLYLKADAQSAATFEAVGGEPLRISYKDGRNETMNYWTVPEEAMESAQEMLPWARAALAAAARAPQKKK
ncbi:TfoX/Sxy family protein [Candidatus Accumulibacter sp. ACC003]|uniref:TfoX/Sxy family protein n=1 Tax=Candidatus Accumulibacter sp. ACC003 TaxID=2823334 RepID=UPI0025BF9492|nr:TfoX/Sxy family protein [Candidatus Accumulibacter sp. ACC003]